MTKNKRVKFERKLSSKGIEVAGLCYQSSALQRLQRELKADTIQVKLDPLEVRNSYVWHPIRALWFEVPIAKSCRLAMARKIEEISRDLYTRVLS
jgi:hypothetical protein